MVHHVRCQGIFWCGKLRTGSTTDDLLARQCRIVVPVLLHKLDNRSVLRVEVLRLDDGSRHHPQLGVGRNVLDEHELIVVGGLEVFLLTLYGHHVHFFVGECTFLWFINLLVGEPHLNLEDFHHTIGLIVGYTKVGLN